MFFRDKVNMPNVGDKITVNITTEASVPQPKAAAK